MKTITLKNIDGTETYKVVNPFIEVVNGKKVISFDDIISNRFFRKLKHQNEFESLCRLVNSAYHTTVSSAKHMSKAAYLEYEADMRKQLNEIYLRKLYSVLTEANLDKNYEPKSLESFHELLNETLAFNIIDLSVVPDMDFLTFLKTSKAKAPKAPKAKAKA
jgi:hypothetical protein